MGQDYYNDELETSLKSNYVVYERLFMDEIHNRTSEEKVVRLFQGRMALHHRWLGYYCIIGGSRSKTM